MLVVRTEVAIIIHVPYIGKKKKRIMTVLV